MQTLANGVKIPDSADLVDPVAMLSELSKSYSDAIGGLGAGKRQPRVYSVATQTEKNGLATLAGLAKGDQVFVEDTAWWEIYDGSAWSIWLTTKAIDWPLAHTGIQVGNGTARFSYSVNGDLITLTGSLLVGSSTTMNGGASARLILPFPMWINGSVSQVGTCQAYKYQGAYWTGSVVGVASANSSVPATQAMTMFDQASAAGLGYLSGTLPFAWAAGDVFSLNLRYRRA